MLERLQNPAGVNGEQERGCWTQKVAILCHFISFLCIGFDINHHHPIGPLAFFRPRPLSHHPPCGVTDKRDEGLATGGPQAAAWGAWWSDCTPGQWHYSGDEGYRNELRRSWGQKECSPAGCTHGISLCSGAITPTWQTGPSLTKKRGDVSRLRAGVTFRLACKICIRLTQFEHAG